jgi:hypothetical protein
MLCFAMVLVSNLSARSRKSAPFHGWLKAGDVVVEDFEGNFKISPVGAKADPKQWQSTGDAFSKVHPAETAAPSGVVLSIGYRWACGKALIYSTHGYRGSRIGASATGTLTSPDFSVTKKYLCFLVGGPDNLQSIAVQLLHEGRVVRAATGAGGVTLRMVAFDTTEFIGKNVRIRLMDEHSSVGGCIVVDRFVQTDAPPTKEIVAGLPKLEPSVVRTVNGILKGDLVTNGDQLTIGDKILQMDEMLSWINPGIAASPKASTGIRLRTGEFWSGDVESYKDGVVNFSGTFGKHVLKLSQISSMNFYEQASSKDDAPNTLYRITADPIPGKLVWIKNWLGKGKDIAVESVVGTLPVPWKQVARYVVEPLKAGDIDPGAMEIALSDGSILYSKAPKISNGQLFMQHPVLGDLKCELSTIVFMRRTPKGALWLETPDKTQATGLVGSGVQPVSRDIGRAGGQRCLSALRMYAKTSATYELPVAQQKGTTLRGTLVPLPNSRANMRVSIKAAGKTVWQTRIPAGGAPVEVALNLPHCKDFTIAVAYDGKVAVPCGVEWLDAHLLTAEAAKNLTKGPNERT